MGVREEAGCITPGIFDTDALLVPPKKSVSHLQKFQFFLLPPPQRTKPVTPRWSYKHGAYSTLQLGYLRPNDQCSQSETPIEGLYLGGASMYPGGMILGGPGYLAAQTVGEFLDKPIITCK